MHPDYQRHPQKLYSYGKDRVRKKEYQQIAHQRFDVSLETCTHLFTGRLGMLLTPALVASDAIAPAVVPPIEGSALGGTCFELRYLRRSILDDTKG